MADYSRPEAAKRAGVEPAYLDRLIELGIIAPGAGDRLSKGDLRRAQMARTLETAGIGLEGLAAGIKGGHLTLAMMDAPTYERFATLSDETFQQLSERTGLPLQLLMVMREATGSAAPEPGDRVREDELAVVPLIEAELAMGFGPQSVERTLRVTGESLRRLAETESHAWRSDLMDPMLAKGMTATQLADYSTGEETVRLDQVMDEALLALWHAHQSHAWGANIISGFEQALTSAGLFTKLSRPPAMCFLDITGYTRLTQERGDEAAASLAESLGRLVNSTSIKHGGRAVKWLGDGVMLHFRDPGPGVVAALDMVDGVTDAGLPPAHVGLHAGPVLFQEGDYFGQTVNVASRIAEYARPGEVLVSQEVVEASADAGATFTEIGPVELKGVAGAVRLHAAHQPA
ncbi:MAG: adenylate/guanylate cyclase domain-containing protein [Chloroflexota bacterium]|nr:adenylate/guanylate cyclase domain-containing protein [Chloroflexota bacterium]